MGKKNDFSAERQSLKDKLMAIILLETAKDHKEMDSDLVTECVDFLMELEGKERLTKAEIEERVSKIPFKGKVTAINSYAKKKIRAKRIAIIAAVLAVLLAICSIVAISFTNSEDNLINRFANYIGEIMNGGDHENFDNIELIKPNESKTFSSVEELVRNEKISLLFPTWLPGESKITKCCYYSEESIGEYYLLCCDDSTYSIFIDIDKSVSKEISTNNLPKIVGKHSVYIINDGISIQGMFEYNGNRYSVISDTEENLLKIIENLKEIE